MQTTLVIKELVLLGGGHSHIAAKTPCSSYAVLLRRVALLLTVSVLLGGCGDSDPLPLAIVNAHIISLDADYPEASALLVEDGRISAIGGEEEIRSRLTAGTPVFDLAGKTVVPGFNDAHMQPMLAPPTAIAVGPPLSAKAELVSAMRSQVEQTPPGRWIVGYGYDDKILGSHLDRHDLDQVSQEHPVVVFHTSFHLMAVNSLALQLSGVDKDTADPEDSLLYRDAAGEPIFRF